MVLDKSLLSAWQSIVCNQAVFAEAVFTKREHPALVAAAGALGSSKRADLTSFLFVRLYREKR